METVAWPASPKSGQAVIRDREETPNEWIGWRVDRPVPFTLTTDNPIGEIHKHPRATFGKGGCSSFKTVFQKQLLRFPGSMVWLKPDRPPARPEILFCSDENQLAGGACHPSPLKRKGGERPSGKRSPPESGRSGSQPVQRVFMSITNRYRTSPFTVRSYASPIRSTPMTSTSEVIPLEAQ